MCLRIDSPGRRLILPVTSSMRAPCGPDPRLMQWLFPQIPDLELIIVGVHLYDALPLLSKIGVTHVHFVHVDCSCAYSSVRNRLSCEIEPVVLTPAESRRVYSEKMLYGQIELSIRRRNRNFHGEVCSKRKRRRGNCLGMRSTLAAVLVWSTGPRVPRPLVPSLPWPHIPHRQHPSGTPDFLSIQTTTCSRIFLPVHLMSRD